MNTLIRVLTAASLALGATFALAQGAPGYGPGGGPAGKGQGWRFNSGNTSGWSLMTPQERTEHRGKMLGFKTYEECKAYQAEHHRLMEARAREKGKAIPAAPRQNLCDRMKSAGRLN
jgi:hypothetical protein